MKQRHLLLFVLVTVLLQSHATFGQYYFGRNKVQYDQFDWHVLKTEHFDIYYYPEMVEIARMGATFAEESYRILEDKFNHNINRRVPLIFYSNQNHFQQTNISPYLIPEGVGGFFEFMKGRVVVPFLGSIGDFRHVIRHELIHVFTTSKIQRVLKDHKKMTYPEVPLWFIEGIAEYWSEGWDADGEMFIRDAVLNGYLFPLQRMYQINGSYLMYKEGQHIMKYIAEEFGEQAILQLIENLWKEDDFSNILKLTIGLNYKEFDEKWVYSLKKEKFPLLRENDAPGMISVPLTKRGFNTKPVFYQDGDKSKLIYISNQTGYASIYLQDLVPAEQKDKNQEVLVEAERTPEFEAFHILKSKIHVSRTGKLVFISKSGSRDVIYVFDLKQRKVIEKFEFNDLIMLSSPAWSPDESRIVFSGANYSGMIDLYWVDVASGNLHKITNDYYEDLDPAWAPNGQAIVFSSDRTAYGKEGFYNLFLFDLATCKIHYLTCNRNNDYTPVFSPDGQFITFTSDRDGVFNIWLLEATTAQQEWLAAAEKSAGNFPATGELPYPTAVTPVNELKQLTNFTTGAYDPAWTADGGLIFTALDNYSMQIMLLKEVPDKFESAPVAQADSIVLADSTWKIAKFGEEAGSSVARYRNKFTLDVAQSQITQDPIFGTSGGAQLAVTDMLGNYQYFFLLYNNAQTRDEFLKSFNVAVSRVDLSRRTNLAVGAYHFSGNYYNYAEGFFYERRYGGFAALSYPFSTFNRIEGSLNIRKSTKEWWGWHKRDALLFSNYLSYIKDNSLWGPTGPLDGERFNLTAGYTFDIQYQNANFYSIIGDYRKYFRTSLKTCLAVRTMLRYNHGKEALPFFMGGSWDLRGYKLWSIWGSKLFLINNEFRFPFIDNFIVNFPFGGIGFSSIRGALFADVGNAWDDHLNQALGAYGFGLRWQLGGVLVLRLDYGRRFYIHHLDQAVSDYTFQVRPGTFTQFFFGWDY